MKVLIFGGAGQLGRCLQDRAPASWQVHAPTSAQVDITQPAQVAGAVASFVPDVLINASSYNAVDAAESDIDRAYAVNAHGPEHMARAARGCGARFFHVSTDYVFDGTRQSPYTEDDTPAPLSVYGQSKRAGELAVLAANPDAIVARTAWLFSEYGKNFVKTILALAAQNKLLTVVNDQVGSPTYAGDLADVLIGLAGRDAITGGIYHFAGREVVTWFEFAGAILAGVPHQLQPITTDDYPARARRPQYSALACRKLQALGFKPHALSENLDYVRSRLASVDSQLAHAVQESIGNHRR